MQESDACGTVIIETPGTVLARIHFRLDMSRVAVRAASWRWVVVAHGVGRKEHAVRLAA